MDLNQLLIFAKVAENQSFTKAAKDLRIEKSTVSAKISQLEERLGTRLLNRTTRSVTLTEAGQGYFQYCQQIVENANEADEFAQTLGSEPQGLLRISAPGDFGRILVKDFLEPFLKKYDKLQVEIYLTEREVDLVSERFDVALRASNAALKDSSLIAKKILDVEMGFFVSTQYLKTHGEIKTLAHLQAQPFVSFMPEQNYNIIVRKNGKEYPLHFIRRITINDVYSCAFAIEAGLGIGILPINTVLDQIKSKTLVRIMQDVNLHTASLYAVFPSRQWIPLKLKVFLDYLNEWGIRQTTL